MVLANLRFWGQRRWEWPLSLQCQHRRPMGKKNEFEWNILFFHILQVNILELSCSPIKQIKRICKLIEHYCYWIAYIVLVQALTALAIFGQVASKTTFEASHSCKEKVFWHFFNFNQFTCNLVNFIYNIYCFTYIIHHG